MLEGRFPILPKNEAATRGFNSTIRFLHPHEEVIYGFDSCEITLLQSLSMSLMIDMAPYVSKVCEELQQADEEVPCLEKQVMKDFILRDANPKFRNVRL